MSADSEVPSPMLAPQARWLNGWRRLFILIALLWFLPVIAMVVSAWPPSINSELSAAEEKAERHNATIAAANVCLRSWLRQSPTPARGEYEPSDRGDPFSDLYGVPSSGKSTSNVKGVGAQASSENSEALRLSDDEVLAIHRRAIATEYMPCSLKEAFQDALPKPDIVAISLQHQTKAKRAALLLVWLGVIPLAVLYILGSLVAWVLRGFRQS